MKTTFLTFTTAFMLIFTVGNSVSMATEKQDEVITASVDCTALGALNGEVSYQYDVTLQNNTNEKFIVDYSVIFKSGSLVKKTHRHSTVLIPGESLTESHTNKMSESEWDTISECWIEWSTRN